jgi:hypothetical protein
MPTIVRNIGNTRNILFSDDFNRADGSIGSNYQICSGSTNLFTIVSNTITTPTNTQFNCVSTGSILFPDDQEVQVTFTSVTSTGFDFCGPGVRINPTNATGYILRMDAFNSNGRGLHRINGTSLTQLGGNLAHAAGQTWSLRARGNRISVYRDGILVLAVTDNTYTSGQAGFYYDPQNNRGTRMDNFIVRSLQNSMIISSTGTRGRIIGRST